MIIKPRLVHGLADADAVVAPANPVPVSVVLHAGLHTASSGFGVGAGSPHDGPPTSAATKWATVTILFASQKRMRIVGIMFSPKCVVDRMGIEPTRVCLQGKPAPSAQPVAARLACRVAVVECLYSDSVQYLSQKKKFQPQTTTPASEPDRSLAGTMTTFCLAAMSDNQLVMGIVNGANYLFSTIHQRDIKS